MFGPCYARALSNFLLTTESSGSNAVSTARYASVFDSVAFMALRMYLQVFPMDAIPGAAPRMDRANERNP